MEQQTPSQGKGRVGNGVGKTDPVSPEKKTHRCDYHKHVTRAVTDKEISVLALPLRGWVTLGKS